MYRIITDVAFDQIARLPSAPLVGHKEVLSELV
jgi:hypothetical protein